MRTRAQRCDRFATVAPLAALLAVPMLAMMAFSVDMSYLVLVRTELQAAADAGSLAAAQSLGAGYVQYMQSTNAISTYTAAATTVAKNIVQANSAGGQSLVFTSGTDIEYGYTDPTTRTYTTSTTYYPNTVKVTTRRDSSTTPVKFFFAPVIGVKNANATATAGASLRTGTVSPPSYAATVAGGFGSGILPLTYNIYWWNNFLLNGLNPDGTTASKDSNGTAYVTAFGGGGSSNALGQANWGWLSLNDSHVGQSDLSNWVTSGMSSSDYTALQSANLFPLSLHNSTTNPTSDSGPSGSWDWVGDNGAKTATAHTINGYIGSVFLIPLYTPVPSTSSVDPGAAGIGKSNAFYYNIVSFAPVVIIDSGDKNSVAVAPASSYPPGTTFTNQQIANTSATRGSNSTGAVVPPNMVLGPGGLTF